MVPVPCALTAADVARLEPARASAARIAWISPRLSRAGAVMWTASLEAAQPSSSPTGSRPSPRARSGEASSSAAAPSPRVSPERARSNGVQGPGESACSAENPEKMNSETASNATTSTEVAAPGGDQLRRPGRARCSPRRRRR